MYEKDNIAVTISLKLNLMLYKGASADNLIKTSRSRLKAWTKPLMADQTLTGMVGPHAGDNSRSFFRGHTGSFGGQSDCHFAQFTQMQK